MNFLYIKSVPPKVVASFRKLSYKGRVYAEDKNDFCFNDHKDSY